jgi:hypothetical protein
LDEIAESDKQPWQKQQDFKAQCLDKINQLPNLDNYSEISKLILKDAKDKLFNNEEQFIEHLNDFKLKNPTMNNNFIKSYSENLKEQKNTTNKKESHSESSDTFKEITNINNVLKDFSDQWDKKGNLEDLLKEFFGKSEKKGYAHSILEYLAGENTPNKLPEKSSLEVLHYNILTKSHFWNQVNNTDQGLAEKFVNQLKECTQDGEGYLKIAHLGIKIERANFENLKLAIENKFKDLGPRVEEKTTRVEEKINSDENPVCPSSYNFGTK